ncbi:MAG TPA: hypothetical protein VFG47_21820, partial [Geminicoccaceae bacterium]|nr:hypothetical protein [Geminicoccaceae bacterium]
LPMTAALAAALLLPVGCDGLHRRGGLGVAPARAQESVPAAILNPIAPGPAAPARLSAQDGTSPGAPALLPDPTRFSPGEIELLQRLGERREALDARERQLELRAAALAMAEARLREQIARLEALRVALEAQLQNRAAVEEARLQSLIKIYERMRPKDAAAIFDRLEMPVLLAVVEGMREAKSAPVIAAMDPAKAERLTTELARRRNLPTSGG